MLLVQSCGEYNGTFTNQNKGETTFVIGGKNNGEPYFHAYKQAPVGRSNAFN